jgi:mannosyltransferase OCH1-like enzyme
VLIPRVFHQIWLGLKPLPEAHRRYQESWLAHHPGWELRLWTEENIPRDLQRPEALERLRPPNERGDFVRPELLWRFGGVYVDTDFECLRSIEPLVTSARFFIGCAKPGHPHDALYGCVAGHPILRMHLDKLVAPEFYGTLASTLPQFRPILEAHRDEVLFLEPHLLHPRKNELGKAYAIHHHEQSWKDPRRLDPKLKRANAKARRWRDRYREAAADADHWRARCEQAEAALEKVRHVHGRAGGKLY